MRRWRQTHQDPSTKFLDLVYSVGAEDNGLSDLSDSKLDPKYAPAGYVNERSVEQMAVYRLAVPRLYSHVCLGGLSRADCDLHS